MAFTFQINRDLSFQHDESLLAKADSNRPEIFCTPIVPTRIVDIVPDPAKLNGFGVSESTKNINHLTDYSFHRGESFILDFGSHYVGRFQIAINSVGSPMDAPLTLKVKFAEMPMELAQDFSDYDGWLSKSWIQEEVIHLDELPATLKLPRRYSFRYVEITVLDTSAKWQAVFSSPLLIAESSADMSRLSKLSLADEKLQRIYDVGVKTLADCMQDVFEDGPKRDRRLWLGDLRLQSLANYATFDQVNLVKRCLYLFAAMPTQEGMISANVFVKPNYLPDDSFLFEYSLFFISTLYDLYDNHSQEESIQALVRELYPTAKKQMDITLSMVEESGKVVPAAICPAFVDWSNQFNKDTAAQAEVIYVLRQFLTLAALVQEPELSKYEHALSLISDFAREKLFVAEKKLFVTGEQEYNIASQVWMVLSHVMTDEENKEIMEQTVKTLFPVKGIATPYMYHHVVQALFEAGMNDEAISLMKSYWGKMIDLGADTYWEAFDPDCPDYSPYGASALNSYCHAWSCTPVYLIWKYLRS